MNSTKAWMITSLSVIEGAIDGEYCFGNNTCLKNTTKLAELDAAFTAREVTVLINVSSETCSLKLR